MPDVTEKPLPTWPLRVALSFLFVADTWLVVRLAAEMKVGNIPGMLISVGLLVFVVCIWRGIPWSRWVLVALVASRVAHIGISMASHFVPGDRRLVGSLILIAFYLAVGLVVASPLGRARLRAAA